MISLKSLNAILIAIAVVCFIASAFQASGISILHARMYEQYIEAQEDEKTAEEATYAMLSSMRLDIEELLKQITLSQERMEEATKIQVEASNQAFIANQAFLQWAISNGFIQEVSDV